ncbi:MAG: energy-coupling factor transporter transmembrane protein EcfT [Chloroflexi bacterium]|nr:energy-coupling factor transporter transmembrane protein EcfT [Chloroflexota bacterium]
MRLLAPLSPDPRAPLARAHPVAKLGGAAALFLALFLAIDPLTPAIILGVLLAALPASGLAPRALVTRAAPLALAALSIALFNTLFGNGGIAGGVAVGLRLLAIGLAGLLALATIDPTDLADALIEHLGAPPRFAIGTLAAFRLLPIFAREWETIGLARRARGIDESSLGDRVRGFAERTLALLVGAIRHATRLAAAMDARGFDSGLPRTRARPRPLQAGDRAWLLAAILLATGATAASIAVGTWRFVLGQ